MQLPLQITFRHMDCSHAAAARIRERAEELDRFFDRIISCRVVVEFQHRRHQQGNLFQVHIDLTVPGREIAVARDTALHAHEDVYVAIRDAFAAARRQLEDHARQARGDVKLHAVPDHGHIARLLPDRDCGFIADGGGNEVYFHRNSVAGDAFRQARCRRRGALRRARRRERRGTAGEQRRADRQAPPAARRQRSR